MIHINLLCGSILLEKVYYGTKIIPLKSIVNFIVVAFVICFMINVVPVNGQVRNIGLDELNSCVNADVKSLVLQIESSYADGIAKQYNIATSKKLSKKKRLENINTFISIQILAFNQLQEIWEQQVESSQKSQSKEYYEEANAIFSNASIPSESSEIDFKDIDAGLSQSNLLHDAIVAMKRALRELFCVGEPQSSLSLNVDSNSLDTSKVVAKSLPQSGADLVVNVDMVNRFVRVWNEANFPLTYDTYVYQPRERELFSNSSLYRYYLKSYGKESADNLTSSAANLPMQTTSTDVGEATRNDADLPQSTVSSSLAEEKPDTYKNNGVGRTTTKNKNSTKDKIVSSATSSTDVSTTKQTKENTVTDKKGEIVEEKKEETILDSPFKEIPSNKKSNISNNADVEYYTIQLAASRKYQHSGDQLKKLYSGADYMVEVREEGGWYKYLLGKFSTLEKAQNFLEKSSIKSAFIAGYTGDKRLGIFGYKSSAITNQMALESAVYRVQIAAAKSPIPEAVLYNVYNGSNPINMFFEDGWYRYSIGDYLLYDEAVAVKDSCGVNGAFIMPYVKGKRYSSIGSIAQLRSQSANRTFYVVQIASLKKPLEGAKVSKHFGKSFAITLRRDGNIFRYYIPASVDYNEAKALVKEVNVEGAFIVTYKNGSVVNP